VKLFPISELKNRIDLLPSYTLVDIYVKGHKVENFKAVVPQGMTSPVAIVSKKYKLVQHKTLFLIVIEKVCWKFNSSNVFGDICFNKNRAFLSLYFQKTKLLNEDYLAGIMVSNSVDTSLSVKVSLSLFNDKTDVVFLNPEKLIEIKNKHLGIELFWSRFKSRLLTILNSFEEILNSYISFLTSLSEIEIDPKEVLSKISLSERIQIRILSTIKSTKALDVYKTIVSCLISEPYLSPTTKIKKIEKLGKIIYSLKGGGLNDD